jgi:hypothetical protein
MDAWRRATDNASSGGRADVDTRRDGHRVRGFGSAYARFDHYRVMTRAWTSAWFGQQLSRRAAAN